ncbi:transposase [Acetobacter orleanensis NRIC 0473]|uniref:Transposase n=1 Tax=Acetobacter orleanensis TaxID=104099 RepID=A0A4Y3TTT7_9PROT|nr:hypothetical protein CO710_13570 [Acetobacter orleanensis]GAN69740.1 transposase [Acetobacter orleanensis JCM 7639]GBR29287.1 transposase [Acetobacter orleanensis NRIC 0473]GEB84185.1 hypothetical protein AOR01nite_26620 [Acetobacter orleanensis]
MHIAANLSIGKSTLIKWIVDYRPTEPASPQADLACENERLRLESRGLREEGEILKKLPSSSRTKSHEMEGTKNPLVLVPVMRPVRGW